MQTNACERKRENLCRNKRYSHLQLRKYRRNCVLLDLPKVLTLPCMRMQSL